MPEVPASPPKRPRGRPRKTAPASPMLDLGWDAPATGTKPQSRSGVPPPAPETKRRRDVSATLSPTKEKKDGGLPSEWKLVRLGDIAQTTSGGTPRRDKPQYYNGSIPWVKSGELGDRVVYETCETLSEEGLASSNAKVFPKGTLCIALYGATVGKLGILGINAATNQAVCAVFPPEGLDTRYLYRFFEGKRRELIKQGKGGAQSNISQGIIRDTLLPIPPLPEQRRIVAEIEKQFTRLEAGVAALKRVQANLKRYRAAVLKAACEGKLVPTEAELARKESRTYETGEALLARILAERRKNWQGRGKYKEPAAPDIANLPNLPEGWTWANVVQASAIIVDCPHSTAKFVADGLPCVDTTCIKPGRIVREKLRFVSPETFKKRVDRLVPAIDDIIFAREGTVGTAVAIPADVQPCLGQRVMLMRADACITARYFEQCLNSEVVRTQYLPKIVGSTAPHINVAEVKRLALPLPPLAEQTRIVAEVERRLSVVDELEAAVSANLQRASRLRQSILQKAFAEGVVPGPDKPQVTMSNLCEATNNA